MEDKYGNRCPNCYTEWKITKFNMHSWKDCTKCRLTAEDIVDKKKKPEGTPPEVPKQESFDVDVNDWQDWIYI